MLCEESVCTVNSVLPIRSLLERTFSCEHTRAHTRACEREREERECVRESGQDTSHGTAFVCERKSPRQNKIDKT